jgi:ribose-phosphate pyrophosphokinase
MPTVLLAMPENEAMAAAVARHLGAQVLTPAMRSFPDGETYLRIDAELRGCKVAVVQTLHHPDGKLLPAIFAADTARALGAAGVGLIAPYLAYMRQDRQFQPGEAVTSKTVARLLSSAFDWLVTVDPHLHRYKSLGDIYTIPSSVLHAAPLIAEWIGKNVESPLLIGPDAESAQWVGDVARRIAAPFAVLEKTRRGDRDVVVRLGGAIEMRQHTPVLVDDMISSGETMLEALRLVKSLSGRQPVCVAVHGLFADGSDVRLAREGARLVTSNTVPHASNAIDAAPLLAAATDQMADTKR